LPTFPYAPAIKKSVTRTEHDVSIKDTKSERIMLAENHNARNYMGKVGGRAGTEIRIDLAELACRV
jgi:hypothetical protein